MVIALIIIGIWLILIYPFAVFMGRRIQKVKTLELLQRMELYGYSSSVNSKKEER